MPSNIEIKARVADPAQTASLAAALSDGPPQTIFQRDTFFRCSTGRLKLREFASGAGELISYIRADVAGVKQSHYEIVPVADAKALQALLHQALGETVVVEKVLSPHGLCLFAVAVMVNDGPPVLSVAS